MRSIAILLFTAIACTVAVPIGSTAAMSKNPPNEPPSKPNDPQLKKELTPEQYQVTQKQGTEAPFHNAYWDNHRAGIYVDVVSGKALFSSLDKFDSGTGWPSFTKPLEPSDIVTREDHSLFETRVEVRSKHADSHLGHLFEDGPAPTGLRYCMNSAAMRFVPLEKMQEEGYGRYLALFGAAAGGGMHRKKASEEIATLAGGCFWGVEEIIRKLPGVLETRVGYTGGTTENPTYEQVKTGRTGHAESIEVRFDPSKLSYEELLGYFFRLHDPTTLDRQENDVGSQYRSAIFYHSEEQRKTAEKVKERVDHSGKWKRPIVTEIVPAGKFYPAEEYHQHYLEKHPHGYTCHYLRN